MLVIFYIKTPLFKVYLYFLKEKLSKTYIVYYNKRFLNNLERFKSRILLKSYN